MPSISWTFLVLKLDKSKYLKELSLNIFFILVTEDVSKLDTLMLVNPGH